MAKNIKMEKLKDPVLVTSPSLPDLGEFTDSLKKIWDSKQLTNNGSYHREFEKQLAEFLGVKYLSLFSNGTLALISALQVLRISGEVITTPYSFVATTHSLWWNGIKPVFVDIEPETMNLDPARIEAAITPKTTAILPVHVYGNPCDVDEIQRISEIYGLKVIYDAAHAFGVTWQGCSVLNFGDLSILSFHATKTFNTIEGGAIICHDEGTKKRIDYLKNFGFADEVTVVAPGINAKMNEVQAAYGLLQIKDFDKQVVKRKKIADLYRKLLSDVNGLAYIDDLKDVKHNYSYFPIFIDENKFGMSRDDLYFKLRELNIFGRRYFYPLISEFPAYRGLPSANPARLVVAERIAKQVICLPIYPELPLRTVETIVDYIKRLS
jgi:dTDP-4-amino-4,6-dideoxygalactose transaminase